MMKNDIKKIIISIGKGLGIIGLYFIVQILLALLFKDCLQSKNELISSLSQMLLYFATLGIIALFFIPELISNLKTFKKEYIKVAFKNWGKGFLIMFISNIFITFYIGNIASNETINRELLGSSPITSIILMFICAPLLEETVFRLNIKKRINNKLAFCITSALLFGGLHLLSITNLKEILYIIPYGSLGYYFAKAYYETDNIYTSVIAHMFHNGLCILAILLGTVLL